MSESGKRDPGSSEELEGEDEQAEELFELGDELDLHTFLPKDVAGLIPDYIDECLARGFTHVRIIHGKGKGTLRRVVHAALERHPGVVHFELAEPFSGGWGATKVELAPLKP